MATVDAGASLIKSAVLGGRFRKSITPMRGLTFGTNKLALVLLMIGFLWLIFYALEYFTQARRVELTNEELERIADRLSEQLNVMKRDADDQEGHDV